MAKTSSSPVSSKVVPKKKGTTAKVSKKGGTAGGSLQVIKDKIFRAVCENHVVGFTLDKERLALECGYKNPRSEKFAKSLKELIEVDGTVSEDLTLTEKGLKMIPDDLDLDKDPTKIHDKYIEILLTKCNLKNESKLRILWDELMDGKPHKIEDLSKLLGYKNVRSFGNTKVIAAMKGMKIAEDAGKGWVKFTDKMFK